jgi:hypothetical protein
MMTLIAAAALAAQAPAAPAHAEAMTPHHAQHQSADHKGMDCCKDCCKDMAAKHEGHDGKHDGHAAE